MEAQDFWQFNPEPTAKIFPFMHFIHEESLSGVHLVYLTISFDPVSLLARNFLPADVCSCDVSPYVGECQPTMIPIHESSSCFMINKINYD